VKRLARLMFAASSAVSLMLCVTTAAVWIAGGLHITGPFQRSWQVDGRRSRHVISRDGLLYVVTQEMTPHPPHWAAVDVSTLGEFKLGDWQRPPILQFITGQTCRLNLTTRSLGLSASNFPVRQQHRPFHRSNYC
jgi:hypothetical protein